MGWSVNEAVAVSVGVGHAMAGRDCVVTMKVPGLYQACDAFTSVSYSGRFFICFENSSHRAYCFFVM